jgi:hypothetical protein
MAIEEGRIEGTEFSFQFKLVTESREIPVAFRGRVVDGRIRGKIAIRVDGEQHTYDWEPKRSLDEIDVLGTWRLAIPLPTGEVFRPSLLIEASEGGRRASLQWSDGLSLPAEIQIEGLKLIVRVRSNGTGPPLGGSFVIEGIPRGTMLNGTLAYEVSGKNGIVALDGNLERGDTSGRDSDEHRPQAAPESEEES